MTAAIILILVAQVVTCYLLGTLYHMVQANHIGIEMLYQYLERKEK